MAWKRSSVRSRPGPPTLLMAAVYILQSESTQKFYIGCTTRLGSRVGEHQRGQTVSTRGRGPWILVYQEQCNTLAGARQLGACPSIVDFGTDARPSCYEKTVRSSLLLYHSG